MNTELRILFLEDNKDDFELINRELRKSGYSYIPKLVSTCDAFECMLDEFKPDLIISDYSLPSFDGVSAFSIKQKKCPEIPFIMVSGTIGEESVVELIKKGITDYALKDKLFTLKPKIDRALTDAEEARKKKLADERIRLLNAKLYEIAFLQSHQVRVPVVHILGLYSLFNFENAADPSNAEVLARLKESAESLDNVIRAITEKTTEIDNLVAVRRA